MTHMSTVRRAPGRPAEFDRTEALDALVELFWQRGYEGATQDVMCDSTGLSSSSLYRTFGTKAQTFQAVLQRYLELYDNILGPLEQGNAGVADLHAMLDRMTGLLGSAAGTRGCMALAITQDPVNQDPQVAAVTGRHLDRIRAAVRAAATRAIDPTRRCPLRWNGSSTSSTRPCWGSWSAPAPGTRTQVWPWSTGYAPCCPIVGDGRPYALRRVRSPKSRWPRA